MAVLIIIILINFYHSNKLKRKKTLYENIDDIKYKLINDSDPDRAAYMLHQLNDFVYIVIKQLKRELHSGQNFGKMEYFVKNLITKYDPSKIEEGEYIREGEPGSNGEILPNGDTADSSYVINKGEKLIMCLRNTHGKFHDMTLLKFIILHEISHIGSIEEQHMNEFWENFKWLLLYVKARNIFSAPDYSKFPIKYCGTIIIRENPIFINQIRYKEIIPEWTEI